MPTREGAPINSFSKRFFAFVAIVFVFTGSAFAREDCLPLLTSTSGGYRQEWQALVDGRFVVSMMLAESGSLEDHSHGLFLKSLNHALALHRIPIQDLNSNKAVKQYADDWTKFFSDIWNEFDQFQKLHGRTYDFSPIHQRIEALHDSITERFDKKKTLTEDFFRGWRNGMIGIVFEVLGTMLFSGDEIMVSKDLRDLGFANKEEEVDIVIRQGNTYRFIELKSGGPGARAAAKGQRLHAVTQRVVKKGHAAKTQLVTLFPLTTVQIEKYLEFFDGVQAVLITLPVQ